MENNKQKKLRVFSGVQPTGDLHLGNYLGAISQWVEIQEKYDCIFCVVDYHAITVKQDPKVLRKKITEIAKIYIASGIDPKRSIIFQQSDIKEHTELAWILNCASARMSDLNKMTQFKDKAKVNELINKETAYFAPDALKKTMEVLDKIYNEGSGSKKEHAIEIGKMLGNAGKSVSRIFENISNVSVGLFDYPVLMAADIILYNTDVVPVGDDQLQHVELARDLAKRFNHDFTKTFKIPKAEIRKEGARIMGLDDPTKKMSKSATSELNYIALTDDPAKAAKKIMRAATDSDTYVRYDKENKPGISNLLTIYSLLDNRRIKDVVKEYEGKGYGDFKKGLAEVVKKFLEDFQEKYNVISDGEVEEIMKMGAEKIHPIAEATVLRAKKAIGVR